MFEYVKPPSGCSPCEATGVIEEIGQEFYFRHRGGQASLSILKKGVAACSAPSSDDLHRFYTKEIKSAGSMHLEQADFLISWWVKQYLKEHRTASAIVEVWFATADKGAEAVAPEAVVQSVLISEYQNMILGSFEIGLRRTVFQLSRTSGRFLSEIGFSPEHVVCADARVYGNNMQITILGVRWRLIFSVPLGEFNARHSDNVRSVNNYAIARLEAAERDDKLGSLI